MQKACNKIKEYPSGSSRQEAMSFGKSRIRPMRGMLNVGWSTVEKVKKKQKQKKRNKKTKRKERIKGGA